MKLKCSIRRDGACCFQDSKNWIKMNIRLEKTEDYREVENLTREAFWNVYRPGCTEHYVFNQYRWRK